MGSLPLVGLARHRWRTAPTLIVALALRATLGGSDVESRPAEERLAGIEPTAASLTLEQPPAVVELSELRRDPRLFLGKSVRFVLQFRQRETRWNPYLTRFGSGDWLCLSGWSDDRFTWNPHVFANPMGRLFVRRGSPLSALVDELRAHERFEVVGHVTEVLLGEPWIEVRSMEPLLEMVGLGVIHHVVRAEEAAGEGKWSLAADQLERALAGPLPARPQAALTRRLEWVRSRPDAGTTPP